MRGGAKTFRGSNTDAGGYLVLGLVGVALLVPATASARTHLAASFHLRGSHGYGITVGTKNGTHRFGKVNVRAGKGSRSTSSAEVGLASYTVPARFNRRRIRAHLGRFGEIRLRFDRNSRFLAPPRRAAQKRKEAVCIQGSSFVTGEFHGVFRFRGESGYTSVHTHRAHGQELRATPLRCRGQDHGIQLEARSGSTRFTAFQDNDYGVTVLSAATRERSGRVEIARQVSRLATPDGGEFTFGSSLTSAHVGPGGALFSGSADYASPSTWIGSLAASFPGERDVPLTGPAFTATLQRGGFPPRAVSTRHATMGEFPHP